MASFPSAGPSASPGGGMPCGHGVVLRAMPAEAQREGRSIADVPHGSAGCGHAAGGREDSSPLGAAGRLDAGDPLRSRRALRARAAAAVARTQAAALRASTRAGANARRTERRIAPRLCRPHPATDQAGRLPKARARSVTGRLASELAPPRPRRLASALTALFSRQLPGAGLAAALAALRRDLTHVLAQRSPHLRLRCPRHA